MRSSERITIELSRDQALVLFEYLARCDDNDDYSFVDVVERQMLWKLQGQLETKLVELFDPDYHEIIALARDAIRDTAG